MRLTLICSLLLGSSLVRAQEPPPETRQSADERIKELEERLNKLEGTPAKASLSSFNPAMGMAIDLAWEHANDKAGFAFRAAELNIEAPIDPYLKGWAVITGTNGQTPTTAGGTPTVDIEEATLETTSLPHNLTIRGGRLFASFGRMAHFHDHELPVIDRPNSLNNFVGGETRADGLEAAFLLPTDLYVNLTAGAYDKMGTNNARVDPSVARPLDEYTYFGRASSYLDIGDDHSVELGLDAAWTPKRTVSENTAVTGAPFATNFHKNTWRTLSGLDFTYRYQPAKGGLYRGIIWGTEVLHNDEGRFDPGTNKPTRRVQAFAGYSYVQLKIDLHWRPGVMGDLTEDQDVAHRLTSTYTAFLIYDVTEFQRIRLTYSDSHVNVAGNPHVHTVGLQWTGVLGHHVHGFRDR